MRLFSLLLVALLAACTDTMTATEWSMAEKLCSDHSGINYVDGHTTARSDWWHITANCKDRVVIKYRWEQKVENEQTH